MITFTLRIDEELMEEFRKLASEEERSANAQLVMLIKDYINSKKNG